MRGNDELADLLKRYLEEDISAEEPFFGAAFLLILGIVRARVKNQELAEDLAQDVVLKLIRNDFRGLRAFDPDCGVRLAGYLKTVAVRKVIEHWRSKAGRQAAMTGDLEDVVEQLVHERSADELIITRELLEIVHRLPPKEKAATLYRLEGLTHEEIGKLMGLTKGGTGTLIWRARKKLEGMLANVDGWRPAVRSASSDD